MITDKLSGRGVPFRLNAAQRRVARIMEGQRRAGKPVRIIMLKARQWGGSTLVQAYMAWHQLVRAKGRNALICAHVKDAAAMIRATYTQLIGCYPEFLKEGDDPSLWKLKPYQQTQGTLWLPAREARLSITSANNPDGLRGASFHLAHLSEAAFWGDGDPRAASSIVRTVCGTVPSAPETVIVIESTANGPDNWFAAEWRRAVAGKSDKLPVFVPWHEIEIYRTPLTPEQRAALPKQLDDYELRLMAEGVSAEALAWYHAKRREYSSHTEMMAEFPSTAEEAFACSVKSPFGDFTERCGHAEKRVIEGRCRLFVASIGERFILVSFGLEKGCITALEKFAAPDAAELMKKAAEELRKNPGAELVIAEAPKPGETRHGRWCVRYARRLGLTLCYAAEEPLLTLTDETLGEMIDVQRHLLAQGMIADTLPEAAELYRRFDPAAPYRHTEVAARMAASVILENELTGNAPDPADFF